MKSLLIIIGLLLSCVYQSGAQELQFSQFFTTSIYLNPAFSGVYTQPSITLNFRRPVQNEAVINESNLISVIYPVFTNPIENTSRGGIGLMAYTSNSGFNGLFETTGVMGNYAHNIPLGTLGSDVLAFGIQAGFESINVALNDLRWGTSYNPFLGFDPGAQTPVSEFNDATNHVIINAGVMYYFNKERDFLLYDISAFSGLAVTNLNQPDKSLRKMGESRAPLLLKYHGGFEVKVNNLSLLPNLLAQYQNGSFSFDAGFYLWYDIGSRHGRSQEGFQLVAGSWYRLRDSFVALAGINYNNASIKLSYDFNNNNIFGGTAGYNRNHAEISIQYNIPTKGRSTGFSNPLF